MIDTYGPNSRPVEADLLQTRPRSSSCTALLDAPASAVRRWLAMAVDGPGPGSRTSGPPDRKSLGERCSCCRSLLRVCVEQDQSGRIRNDRNQRFRLTRLTPRVRVHSSLQKSSAGTDTCRTDRELAQR